MTDKKKKCALVGFFPGTRHLAPYDDPEWEIWGCNEGYNHGFMKRWTQWFQIHQRWDFTKVNNRSDPDHWVWLQEEHDFPIYMQEKHDDIPASVKFPLEEVRERFGVAYFTSSFGYMIAKALLDGYDEIGIYGFEMATDTEYKYQRPNSEWWIGIAIGMGVKIVVPKGCGWMKSKLYGYEVSQMINRQRLETIKAMLEAEHHQVVADMNEALGQQRGMQELVQKKQLTGKKFHKRLEDLKKDVDHKTGLANKAMGRSELCDFLIKEIDMQLSEDTEAIGELMGEEYFAPSGEPDNLVDLSEFKVQEVEDAGQEEEAAETPTES